jgi:hypothetical protein
MKSLLKTLLLLFVLPTVVSADAPKAKTHKEHAHAKDRKDRPEIFGGFSHTKSGSAGLNGLEVSGGFPFKNRLQLVADLSHHSGSFGGADLGQTTFLLGIARHGHFLRFRPFVRGLVGLVHSTTSAGGLSDGGNNLAFGAGGGATYPVAKRLGVRGQVDLLLVHGSGTWDLDPRFGIGLAYRL